MTKYVNRNTGAVIETDCQLLGVWVPNGTLPVLKFMETPQSNEAFEQPKVEEEVIEEEVAEKIVEDDDGIDGVTVKQIKQELDAFGIAYDPRAKKKELYDLMTQGK